MDFPGVSCGAVWRGARRARDVATSAQDLEQHVADGRKIETHSALAGLALSRTARSAHASNAAIERR